MGRKKLRLLANVLFWLLITVNQWIVTCLSTPRVMFLWVSFFCNYKCFYDMKNVPLVSLRQTINLPRMIRQGNICTASPPVPSQMDHSPHSQTPDESKQQKRTCPAVSYSPSKCCLPPTVTVTRGEEKRRVHKCELPSGGFTCLHANIFLGGKDKHMPHPCIF